MAITAAQVKELREMTGAGMMDCKKALTATEGDMDKAVEFLREKGLATAQKKASRVAAEGLCKTLVSEDGKKAVVVEVNAETDFVAKNEKFQNYVADVAAQAMNTTAADIDAFLAEAWALDTTKTVNEALAAQIAVIGENMNIRRFAKVEEANGFVASYTHMGGKIGVLVDVETDVVNDAVKEMAKNVAMQIAALNPKYTDESEVSADFIAHEKEILMAQIQNDPKESQKPEKVIQGMIAGRIKKEMKEMFPEYEEKKERALEISRWNIPPHHIKRQVVSMMHTPTGKTAFDNEKYFPVKENGTPVKGYRNTYKRQNWDTPAYTVTMDNRKISSQNNVHPGRYLGKDKNGDDVYSDARTLTLYELMLVMSLPSDWPVPEKTSEAFLRRIIGEGIPPLFVKKVFEKLIER